MVGINDSCLPSSFINSYITLDYKAVIVFNKLEEDKEIDNFLNYINNNDNLKEIITEEDEYVLIFQVKDEEDITNFNKFLSGKYSEFTEKYKNKIRNYHGRETIKENYTVTPYNVIYPQTFKREQIARRLYDNKDFKEGLKNIVEVLDAPDLTKEVFVPIQELTKQITEQIQ